MLFPRFIFRNVTATTLIVMLVSGLIAKGLDEPKLFQDSGPSEEAVRSGISKFKAKDYAGALMDYEKAMRSSPNNAAFFVSKALESQAHGNREDAIREFQEANARYPGLTFIYYQSGSTRLRIGDYHGGVLDLTIAVNLKPDFGDAYGVRGDCMMGLEEYAEAGNDFSRAITFGGGKQGFAYLRRGQAIYAAGDAKGAIEDFSHAITLNPSLVKAFHARAYAYYLTGEKDRALADATHIVETWPKYPAAYRDRAWLYLLQGDNARAFEDYETAIKSESDTVAIFRVLATAFDIADKRQDAIAPYQRAIREDTKDRKGNAYVRLQFNLLQARISGSALKLDKHFDDLLQWPDDWLKRILLYLSGRITADSLIKAATQESRPHRRAEQECEAYYYVGIMNELNGEIDTARSCFERCLATGRFEMVEFGFASGRLRQLSAK